MNLNQLYYFQAVAKYENYRKAAEILYVSQPSLSRSIDSLEQELGIQLFEKKGRGVTLTKAGLLFRQHVDQIIFDCSVATKRMKQLSEGTGQIDIGYIFPLAGHYIPHKVRQFLNQEENKEINFNFYQNHTPNILKKVKSGELDIGFGAYVEKEEEVEFFPLLDRKMVIITPLEHPLAKEDSLSIEELEKFPVIGYDRESGLGNFTKSLYRRLNLHPSIVVECPDEHSIQALVEEGFGIALVPLLESIDEARVHVMQLNDIELVNKNFMFWLKDSYHVPVVDRFIDFMKQQAGIED